jgi:uncharacterized protein
MKKDKVAVIIDVNIWISCVIGQSQILEKVSVILLQKNIELIICHQLIAELNSSLQKPKLQKYLNHGMVSKIVLLLENAASFIEVRSDILLCRDEKDNYLLGLARDGQADFLITGDKDLLVLNPFENTQIVTLNEFVTLFEI